MDKSELILNKDGSVYHLKLKSENLSSTVILVGDPFRVDKITKHFDKIEFKTQNREFKSVTGYYKSKRITVVSTGIGYLGYIRLIDRIGAVKTSTLTYLLPVFSILWGAIFLQEQITLIIFGGFIFVMMGMYFANTTKVKIKN